MKEKVFRKTVEVIERPVAASTAQKTFSTEPKTRRHRRQSISGNRARDFMQHLWREGFRESCHYRALKIKFIQYFEMNDPRVVEKYIGRPTSKIRYSGTSVVRQNRTSGKIAHFMFSNERTVEAKAGLMELLGYITLNRKTGWVTLHHEVMSHYTKQVTFDEGVSLKYDSPHNRLSKKLMKDLLKNHPSNICVCALYRQRARDFFVCFWFWAYLAYNKT